MPPFKRQSSGSAATVLRDAAKLYDDKNAIYGDAFVVVGEVMAKLFPDGVNLKNPEDFRRFHLFEWNIGKMVRYAQTFSDGGHDDSILDASVYSAMLAYEDAFLKEEKDGK